MKYIILLVFSGFLVFNAACYSGLGCKICHSIIQNFHNLLSSQESTKIFAAIFTKICYQIQPKMLCDQEIETFLPVWGAVTDLLNSTIICSSLNFCDNPIIIKDLDRDFLKRVLRDTPPKITRNTKFHKIINEKSELMKILVFTDAHLDFGYMEGKSTRCNFTSCCRVDSGDPIKPEEAAGPYGHVGLCDIPTKTVDSFLDQLEKINPDLVLWLGDNPAHDTYEQRKETHLNALNYISKGILKRYKGPVYFVTGNHDGLPDGQFDVHGNRSQWILDGFSKVAENWYSQEGIFIEKIIIKTGIENVKKYGRFSELVKGTKLRIIGLNNFVMDFTNTFLFSNVTDALGQAFFPIFIQNSYLG